MKHALIAVAVMTCAAVAQADPPPAGHWQTVWQYAWKDHAAGFDPEKISVVVNVDRTTGDAYVAGWGMGVWKSVDGGETFVRIDGEKVTGPNCGPIAGNALVVSPEGGKMALFNMNNQPGKSGYSLDGGRTWQTLEDVGRNWDFGSMDFASRTMIGARHEFSTLHASRDGGQTWTQLDKSRVSPMITGLGAVGPGVLLAATDRQIERSADLGKSWEKVSDLGAFGPVQSLKGRLWLLSGPRDKGERRLIVSDDNGKTWAAQGSPVPKHAYYGPFFGKDESHVVVVTDAGFYESTDAGKSWKLAAGLPDNHRIDGWQSGAWDPVHDVFYATTRQRALMEFRRGGRDVVAGPEAPLPDSRRMIHIESIGGRPRLRVLNVYGVDVVGDYVYVSSEDGVVYLKRDAATGKPELVGQVGDPRGGTVGICGVGRRAYAVTPHDGYRRLSWHGLSWYEMDAATGKPTRQREVECPASRLMIASPDGRDLYLRSCRDKQDKLFWYRVGDDGLPARGGEVAGKGIGASAHNDYPGLMVMSPDGRSIYCASADDYAVAVVQRQPDGKIAYTGSVDLTPVAKRIEGNDAYLWLSLAVSPDGKYLYAAVRNGPDEQNFYGIFKRDAKTGGLTFQESVSGVKDPLANLRAWSVLFDADGRTGCLGSLVGPFMTFTYDSACGHLTDAAAVRGTLNHGSLWLARDPAGVFYAGGGDYGIAGWMLDVMKATPADGAK